MAEACGFACVIGGKALFRSTISESVVMRNLVFAVASLVALSGLALSTPTAQAEQKGNKPGQGQKGQKGQNGQKAQGKRGQAQRPEPAAIAAKMIQNFDRNGDKALNAQELAAALTSMRDQRGNRGAGPGQSGRGGKGMGKGGQGKGRAGRGRQGKGRRPGNGN